MASRGRPAGRNLTERIGICVTPELKAAMQNVAAVEERSFSSMCSIMIEEWIRSRKSKYGGAVKILDEAQPNS